MTMHHVVILGAGAAGTAAARALAQREDIRLTLIARTNETPYARMLIKNVAFGPTAPELISLPLPQTDFLADTAKSVDKATREVHLASGKTITFDSLIIATGSHPRSLETNVTGAEAAVAAETLTTLHSLEDALRIRDGLRNHERAARVAIYGAGLTASETASALEAEGHQVTLIARSITPGTAAFGRSVAERITARHHAKVGTFFGRTITRITSAPAATVLTLDDGTEVPVDLIVLALGTTPAPPAPWNTGINVDDRLRAQDQPGVYAAGGVAVHHDDHLGTWHIDHWEDGASQGAHAAQVLLHNLGLAEDPGPYRPRSPYMAIVYGQMISGVGFTGHPNTRVTDADEFVVLHELGDTVVGASGIDAVGTIYQWSQHLHEARS